MYKSCVFYFIQPSIFSLSLRLSAFYSESGDQLYLLLDKKTTYAGNVGDLFPLLAKLPRRPDLHRRRAAGRPLFRPPSAENAAFLAVPSVLAVQAVSNNVC